LLRLLRQNLEITRRGRADLGSDRSRCNGKPERHCHQQKEVPRFKDMTAENSVAIACRKNDKTSSNYGEKTTEPSTPALLPEVDGFVGCKTSCQLDGPLGRPPVRS
jgi:hypothetical protein